MNKVWWLLALVVVVIVVVIIVSKSGGKKQGQGQGVLVTDLNAIENMMDYSAIKEKYGDLNALDRMKSIEIMQELSGSRKTVKWQGWVLAVGTNRQLQITMTQGGKTPDVTVGVVGTSMPAVQAGQKVEFGGELSGLAGGSIIVASGVFRVIE